MLIEYAIIFVTPECNKECEYCDIQKKFKAPNKDIIRNNLKNLLKYCSIKKAVLSGGEPGLLEKEFLEEIMMLLRESGTEQIHVNSNGLTSKLNPKGADSYTIHIIDFNKIPDPIPNKIKYDYVITSENLPLLLEEAEKPNNFIDKIYESGNTVSFKKYNNKVNMSYSIKDNDFRYILNQKRFPAITTHRDYGTYDFLEKHADFEKHRVDCINGRSLIGFDICENKILQCTVSYTKTPKVEISKENVKKLINHSLFYKYAEVPDMCKGCHIRIFGDIRDKEYDKFTFNSKNIKNVFAKIQNAG